MQKTLQRCHSTSLRLALSRLTGNSRTLAQLSRQTERPTLPSKRIFLNVRTLHVTSIARQQAVGSQPSHVETSEGNDVITKFRELQDRGFVHENIVRTITKDMGLETMTEVQTATVNAALAGSDIIAQAKTGTGKTLAFLLPILQRVIQADPELAARSSGRAMRRSRVTGGDIRAIIVSPTRELAEQIAAEATRVTANTGLLVRTAVGGTHKASGLRAIQQGCHLLVGTPGRLKDILSDPSSRVEAPSLDALVFDEADRLLDQGFWPEIQEIMQMLPTQAERSRQTMMFSATVPREVIDLVRRTLKPGFQYVKCVRDDEEPTHTRVPQRLIVAKRLENSFPALVELCTRMIDESKQPGGRPFKAIVYFNSTAEVSLAYSAMRNLRNPSDTSDDALGDHHGSHPWSSTRIHQIHARLSQAMRTRASDTFRQCQSGILLSSDVTARGMDFPNVTHVIQVGLVSNREQYIHRVGRTARAGKEGEAWMIVTNLERDETQYRLRGLPLKKDDSLITANLDLSQPADVTTKAGKILSMAKQGLERSPNEEKSAVYRAFLGVFSWLGRKQYLIEDMNRLASYCWGMAQPPMISPTLAAKLKINRVPGIRLGHDEDLHDRRGRDGDRDGRRMAGVDRGSGGFGRREGGFNRREGGFERREGGFERREGGFERRGSSRPSYGSSPTSYNRQGGDRNSGSRRSSSFMD